jgi:hypothetical protein
MQIFGSLKPTHPRQRREKNARAGSGKNNTGGGRAGCRERRRSFLPNSVHPSVAALVHPVSQTLTAKVVGM